MNDHKVSLALRRRHDVKVYHILNMDTPVADVVMGENNLVREIHKLVPDSPIQPFWGDVESVSPQVLTERFYNFLADRRYEDGRSDLPMILKQAGLDSNNPYEWVHICHGVTHEDFFWVRFDNEDIAWKDVKIRE